MAVHSLVQFDTLADLKGYDVSSWTSTSLQSSALLIDCALPGDEKGGLYRWQSDSTATEDFQYYNVISSSSTTTGRWLRVFQKAKTYSQGTLVSFGGIKTMYINGQTDGAGQFTANLTTDNTTTGPALFTEVWKVAGYSKGSVTNMLNAPSSYPKVFPDANNNSKYVTMQFTKPSAPTTLVAGLTPLPITVIDVNTPVVIEIVGI